MNEEDFCTEFKREYLRYCQRDLSILTGIFDTVEGLPVVWGAIGEYGDPPPGGLLVEIWGENNEKKGEYATYRFWYARTTATGKLVKGRVILRDELTTPAAIA